MAKKKQEPEKKKKIDTSGVVGLVGSTTEQAISETLELNYMPYAMSVIVSRAIPENIRTNTCRVSDLSLVETH